MLLKGKASIQTACRNPAGASRDPVETPKWSLLARDPLPVTETRGGSSGWQHRQPPSAGSSLPSCGCPGPCGPGPCWDKALAAEWQLKRSKLKSRFRKGWVVLTHSEARSWFIVPVEF